MTDKVKGEQELRDELTADQRMTGVEADFGEARDLQNAQERLLALSRIAAKVQSVLDYDRIFETIGDELSNLGLNCFFGLLDNGRDGVVVRHTNVRQSALRAAAKLSGAQVVGFRFPLGGSPHLLSVLDEGRALFDDQPEQSIRETLPPPLKPFAAQVARLFQARKAISAPLVSGEGILGILTVWSDDLTEEDVPSVSIFAQQAAMAMENASLYEDEMRRVFEMEALRKTTLDITRQLDLKQLLRSIVERAASLAGTKAGGLYLYDQRHEELELAVNLHLGDDYTGTRLKLGEGLSGKVALTGEPRIVQDYTSWEGRSDKYARTAFRTVMAVPLKWGDKIMGVVNVTDVEKARVFTDRDLRLLELFASQAAIAIENARLFEEQEQRSQELMALHETSLHLISRLDLDSLLEATISRALKLLGGRTGDVYLYRAREDDLTSAASIGLPPPLKEAVMKSGEGLAGRVLETGEPLVVDDYDSWEGRAEAYAGYGFGRVLGVPITYGGELLGVVVVEREPVSPRFVQRDVDLLSAFGNQVAIAIENSRLYEETKGTAEELAALYEISMEMAAQLEVSALLNTVTERAIDLLGARSGGVYLYDPGSKELELIVVQGQTGDYAGLRLAVGEGVCGNVAETGEPMVVTDYSNWEGRSSQYDEEPNTNVLGVPIKRGDTLLGALFVDDTDLEREFDEDDMRLATLFANQAAIAIENARLFAEREHTIEQLAALHEVSLKVLAETELSEVLPTIVQQAIHLLDADAGALDQFDTESQRLEMMVGWGYAEDAREISLAVGEGVAGNVAQTHEPLTVDDYAHWDARLPQPDKREIRAALGVPLMRGNEFMGVLTIARGAARPFDQDNVQLATLFANQAAIAIDNARSLTTAQKRVAELTALREISLQLTQSLDLSTVLDTIARSAVELVKASDAHIFLYGQETEEFTFGTGFWAPDQEGEIFTKVRKNGLTATVAGLGEPVVISEAGDHPLCRDQDWGVEAIAGFPLRQADRVLGVFNVAFMKPHTFDEDELRLLTLLADQAAVAIENARLYQETDRRLKESTILQELSRLVGSSLEPKTVFQTVVQTVAEALGYSMVSIYTTDGEGLRLGAHVGYRLAEVLDHIPSDRGVIGRVARSGEAELVYDVKEDPDYLEAAPEVVSEVAVPVMRDSEVLGVLNVESTALEPLTVADLKLVSSMGHQVSVAIQNAQLYQAAQRELEERKRAELELQQSYDRLETTFEGTVKALAALAEARDPYTAGHQQEVARLASAIAEEMGLPEDEVLGIRMAGLVHDIGKICVPAEILSKPTSLTEIETQMIQTHPQTAHDILKTVEFPWPVAEIVLQHHERIDGSGYPRGLLGHEMLLAARVLCVADTVEAMASNRPYRPAHGIEEALEEILQRRGAFYDAEVVEACLKLFREKGFKLQHE
jgi:putative nucleotidyltransferase with HDIG domain